MKTKLLTLAACSLVSGWISSFAETPDAATPPPPPPPPPERPMGKPDGKMRDMMRERVLNNLPPEIKQRFEAAREKALQDPKIQELRQNADKANAEFFKAMRGKMQEIDPGLGEIIKKQAGGKDRRGDGGKGRPPGLGNLTEAEQQKLQAAREKAKSEPAVQAAEKKKRDATTPEERKTASEEFRKTMRAAILQADPSIAPLLEKLGPKPPPPAPPGPGGDGEMSPET